MKYIPYLKTQILLAASALMFALSLTSCGEDTPSEPAKDESIKSTVLLYAVASNNLYSNLIDDKEEILTAASQMDLTGLRMLVYQVTPYDEPSLLELKKGADGTATFVTVKEYSKDMYSTDPRRIAEVIDYVKTEYVSALYGLVLWSHGTGLDPFTSTRSDDGDEEEDNLHRSLPMLYSFGQDKNGSDEDRINIDELADAIPDNLFNFIWFDACYMSGIETIYELRDKCEYFVGYPTEVFTPGMPYDLTLPYFLAEKPNLAGGAEAFFKYYAEHSSSSYRVATVCVVDMDKLEPVADFCKTAYVGAYLSSGVGLQKYTRGSIGPFYDFGQYTRLMSAQNDSYADIEAFEKALDDLVIYAAATDVDFNYNAINQENFSGISCHLFFDDGGSKLEFYKTLDWYKRVYE